MTIEYDFSMLRSIYLETIHSPEKAVAFDIQYAKGDFLFMLFLSDEDKNNKDYLFVYMRNTNIMKQIKMYGNHVNGKFLVYFNDQLQSDFTNEMKLGKSHSGFSFSSFLDYLNANFPKSISREKRKQNLYANRINISRIADDEKCILIGPRKVTNGHPQEKTLRKLYLYTNANAEDLDRLTSVLRRTNQTVAWTTPDMAYKAVDIYNIISNYC